MTEASMTAGPWDGPRRKLLVRAMICVLVAAGLAIFAGGPTWGAVGLSIAFMAGSFLAGLPTGRLLGRSADPARHIRVVMVVHLALQELIRLGLVLWSGVSAVEAAWIGLLGWGLVLPLGLVGLRRLPAAGRRPQERPEPALGPVYVLISGGMIAKEMAAWLLVVWNPLLVLLTFAVQAGAGLLELRAERKQVFGAVAGYALMALALVVWLT
ncbi:hypothetical protein [Nonomuraea sp. B5E05]|uniref:hypothetical protein n=1 Tax=Nonomuraea sp. B5E05 TaxID=3153569 RepID=UPI003260E885